jgi:hypothetical protein
MIRQHLSWHSTYDEAVTQRDTYDSSEHLLQIRRKSKGFELVERIAGSDGQSKVSTNFKRKKRGKFRGVGNLGGL